MNFSRYHRPAILTILLMMALMISFTLPALAQTAVMPSGSGTKYNPYEIATLDNLYWLSQNPSYWGGLGGSNYYYFQLTADIDADSTKYWDGGKGFSPIGNSSTVFSSDFDGNGHKITGLYINRPTTDYVGLFGFARDNSNKSGYGVSIKSLSVIDANITGQNNVGVVAGTFNGATYGQINNVFSNGIVKGNDTVGGLAGNLSSIYISNNAIAYLGSICYVNGSNQVGGLAGYLSCSSINQVYSAGFVAGSTEEGALIGYNNGTTINYAYYDKQVSSAGGSGTGKNTAQLQGTLPSGFSSGEWYTTTGRYPSPLNKKVGHVINGTAYQDAGSTPLVSSSSGPQYVYLISGGTTIYPTFTGGNGYFYLIEPNDSSNNIVYTSGSSGGINFFDNDQTGYNLNIYGNQLIDSTTTTSYSAALTEVSSAIGSHSDVSSILSATNKTTIYANSSSAFSLDESPSKDLSVNTTGSSTDIDIPNALTVSGSISLSLNAAGNINMEKTITVPGGAGISLTAGGDYYFGPGSNLSFSGGSGAGASLSINGSSYTLVYDITGLQQINNGLNKNYALAESIDASGTSGWTPLGSNGSGGAYNSGKGFNGIFTGLGHSITNLSISSSARYTGLFGYMKGTIRDVGFSGGSVSGGNDTGGLIGYNNGGTIKDVYVNIPVSGSSDSGGIAGYSSGTITNSYSTGAVSGVGNVGGLAGTSSGVISYSYATGAVTGSSSTGGLTGTNSGTVTDGYWDTQSSGLSPGSGNGYTTSQLQGTLPSGFSSAVWTTSAGLYPYLQWQYSSTPQYITGKAYTDFGSTAATSSTVTALVDGTVDGTASVGADAYYYIPMSSGTISAGSALLAYSSGSNGGAADTSASSSVTGLDVYGNAMHYQTDVTSYSALSSTLSQAEGANTVASSFVGNLSGEYISTASSSFNIDEKLARGLYIYTTGSGGNITVSDSVSASGSEGLTLNTIGNIIFDAPATIEGSGAVSLAAGGDYQINGGGLTFTGGSGAGASLSINGTSYTLLYDMTGVQNINNNLSGDYALAESIDASGTSSWTPIGTNGSGTISNSGNGFMGIFAGLGHTISKLKINIGSNNYSGLFGYSSGTIRDLGLFDATIKGGNYTGGVTGYNNGGTINNTFAVQTNLNGSSYTGSVTGDNTGSITNSYATGGVFGSSNVGGLTGQNTGTINMAYSTGVVVGTSSAGGLAGNNSGTVTDGYWDKESSGITSGAGTGDSTASLQGTLPSGFNSSLWSTGSGLYPYFKWQYPSTPQVVSGTAYSDTGSTLLESGSSGLKYVSLLVNGTGYDSTATGANGYYYFIEPSGTISGSGAVATYTTGSNEATGFSGASGSVTGLDVYTGGVYCQAGGTSYSALSTIISDATGSNTALATYADNEADQYLATATNFSINKKITTQRTIKTLGNSSDLTVADSVNLAGSKGITLSAGGNLIISSPMIISGSGAVSLAAGSDYILGSGNISFTGGSGAGASLSINGNPYTLLYDISGVQNINNNLTGNYALATNLDASGVSPWIPIGTNGTGTVNNSGKGFTGKFTGLGHTISNLTVKIGTNNYAGPFGYIGSGGEVRDVGFPDVFVKGGSNIGGIAGFDNGGMSEAYAVGSVSGTQYVGGLAGIVGSSGSIANSYTACAVAGTNYIGGVTSELDNGSLTYDYSTGDVSVTKGGFSGGLISTVGGGSTLSDCYWDTLTTTKSGNLIGSGENTSQLKGSLPSGLSSTIWGTGTNLYPYFLWEYPSTPQPVSGTAYTDAGTTPDASDTTGAAYVSLLIDGARYDSVSTGVNGSYYITVPSGTISGSSAVLAYTTGTYSGGTISNSEVADTGQAIYGQVLIGTTSDTSYSAASGSGFSSLVSQATGSYSAVTNAMNALSPGFVATGSGFTIDMPVSKQVYIKTTSANAGITVDDTLSLSGSAGLTLDATGDINFDAPVSIAGNGAVYLNSGGDYRFGIGKSLSFTGGSSSGASLTINGTTYSLLYTMSDVQNIDNNLIGDYALAKSIDASGTTGWTPIGTNGSGTVSNSGNGFAGALEGLGHIILNLSVNIGDNRYAGLFGYTNGTIRDLGITGGSVIGGQFVGALAGYNNGSIMYAITSDSVSGTRAVGGLVGRNGSGTMKDDYATGPVSETVSTGEYFGGLVGTNTGAIEQSFATGKTDAYTSIGGLAGLNDTGGTLTDVYATGAVTSDGSSNVGGLVGSNTSGVTNAYSNGLVTAPAGVSGVGGLVGYNNSGTVTNGYWDTQTSGQSTSAGGGTGLSTAQLLGSLPSGFSSSVWGTGSGVYPYLIWHYSTAPVSITISGTAYTDAGSTPDASATITVLIDGALFGSNTTDASGKYQITATSSVISNGADILAYTDGSNPGATAENTSGSVSGFDIYGGMINHQTTTATTYSADPLQDISTVASQAAGSYPTASSLVQSLPQGYITSGADFTLDQSLSKSIYLKTTAADANITIADSVALSGSQSLSLDASGHINVDAPVSVTNGAVSLTAGQGYSIGSGDSLSFTGGSGSGASLSINDTSYTLLYSLSDVASISNNLNGHYALATSIDASGVSSWTPLGTVSSGKLDNNGFTGIFEGLGHHVSNLALNLGSYTDAGLFGYSSGTIRDVGLVSDTLVCNGGNAGTLLGFNSYGTILNCYSTGALSGTSSANGGLVGVSRGGEITECYARVDVSGNGIVGGLIGDCGSTPVSNSYASGSVTLNANHYNAGGLAGSMGSDTVENVYATGSVTGLSGASDLGGLVGENEGTLINAYATGKVTLGSGGSAAGGLVGASLANKTVSNGYWDTQTTGQSASIGGGTGLSTARMKDSTNFAGFDFSGTWAISQNATFPWLRSLGSTVRQGGPELTGSPNWHMLGSPFTSSTYATLLDSLWTQGFSGADTTGGSPNVYTWDEASQSWTAPSSLNATLPAGQGFIVYLYTDDNPRLAGTQGGFPKNLYYSGSVNTLPETISLSYTSGGTTSLDGFNLVANPSASPVNWEQVTKTNVSDTYYVWNPAGGNYATYQAGVGGTNGGSSIIAPFQGFWVQATGSEASIKIDSTATDTGGTLYAAPPSPAEQVKGSLAGTDANPSQANTIPAREAPHSAPGGRTLGSRKVPGARSGALTIPTAGLTTKPTSTTTTAANSDAGKAAQTTQSASLPTILLKLSGGGHSDEVRLVLRNGAKAGLDSYDAVHLTPLASSCVSLSSQVDSAALAIDSRPAPQGKAITMNLLAGNVNLSGSLDTLSLAQNKLPKGWTITVKDRSTGAQYTLDSLGVAVSVKQISLKTAGGGPVRTAGAAANWQVILSPPDLTAIDNTTVQKPVKLALRQNYPNPFNPTTMIRYALPKAGQVSLTIYNILGQRVETLVDSKETAGYYQVRFDASRLASGLYLYRLSTPSGAITKHMILLK